MGLPTGVPCEEVMDSIADGVFTVDLEWNVTFFNRAAENITGIPRAEAVGRKCWEVFHSSLCDGSCALEQCMDEDVRLSGKSIFIIRPDGEKTPISISAAPLRNADGALVGGVETFRDLTEIVRLRRELADRYVFEDIVGKSSALTRLFDIMPQIAASNATVLITGESGTGKELFARALHSLSERASGPFVAVNCGALPETLLESELFGYKAGAFTDAKKDKPGRFRQASGGTIFLDEIAELAPSLQVKLLRVLQEKQYEPLGAVQPEEADVRVLAATNRDLDALVAAEEFRQDLFYRLNVVRLSIPPLRERAEDIPLLAQHIVEKLNRRQGAAVEGLSENALTLLMRHSFPGNVRELENVLEYAFILCKEGFIEAEHLPEYLRREHAQSLSTAATAGAQPPLSAADDVDALMHLGPRTMDEVKRLAARAAVRRNDGKRMAASRELGVTKDTLRKLLQNNSGE
ncbi:sigma-54 interaction domain-containing protein [Oceanidesulfovibrio marinus]|uniref:Fis family transcriptional regulator n=1 Tax=Oceanidesulfovibrio marinus TaxID=370038 RepID=A0A6P1ZC21_9BACT|nr:sigma 54-interacting transcriptional regulator [Oceanidesulfovibrio marinus]QJT11142.1 PAS domain-containing protein [Oceanidesulfovibrio marinus]TVM31688.1 Fis family transcriptional regulator [Oceanidesulfovibrio marinus]